MSDIRTDLTRQFEMAAGTTTGAMHRRLDKNNQDAYGIIPVSYTHLDVYKRQDLSMPQHLL